MTRHVLLGSLLAAAIVVATGALAQEAPAAKGQVVSVVVPGPSLVGNLLGTPTDRPVSVYLPPSYDQATGATFPVVYLLHSLGGGDYSWLPRTLMERNIPALADTLIAAGTIQPMILVMPDASTRYGACFYANSPVCGNWEDFITTDLVGYVDDHYRTVAGPQGRAVAGMDVGGTGALTLAMKHPDVFGAAYAMSPLNTALVDPDKSALYSRDAFAMLAPDRALGVASPSYMSQAQLAMAAAASPNPEHEPYFVDLPYELVNGQLEQQSTVWDAWVAHTPMAMIESHRTQLLSLRALGIDAGTNDQSHDVVAETQAFHDALTRAGIPHRFEVYPGDYFNMVEQRMGSVALPFLSDALEGGGEATIGTP
ncbi:MAG: alpha/beta hydrolase-fold protein [Deinococcales bacterium]